MESLPDIFVLDPGELQQTLGAIRIERGNLDHPPHGKAEIPETRLPIHPLRMIGDSVEFDHALVINADRWLKREVGRSERGRRFVT